MMTMLTRGMSNRNNKNSENTSNTLKAKTRRVTATALTKSPTTTTARTYSGGAMQLRTDYCSPEKNEKGSYLKKNGATK